MPRTLLSPFLSTRSWRQRSAIATRHTKSSRFPVIAFRASGNFFLLVFSPIGRRVLSGRFSSEMRRGESSQPSVPDFSKDPAPSSLIVCRLPYSRILPTVQRNSYTPNPVNSLEFVVIDRARELRLSSTPVPVLSPNPPIPKFQSPLSPTATLPLRKLPAFCESAGFFPHPTQSPTNYSSRPFSADSLSSPEALPPRSTHQSSVSSEGNRPPQR